MAKQIRRRVCQVCSLAPRVKGTAARYCRSCGKQEAAKAAKRKSIRYQLRIGVKVGAGKGGANAKGRADSQYRNGIGLFRRLSPQIKRQRRFCNRCDKDLLHLTGPNWAVHHRDRNRANNRLSNLELLCKRCHQLEHRCDLAFSKQPLPLAA